jgi:hypothetical protein
LKVLLLRAGEVRVAVDDVVVRREEEAAGAAGRIADRFLRPRVHHLHDGLDQRPRREVLPRAVRASRSTR